MREIRVYVEGGGDRDSKASLRAGFHKFFSELQEKAARKNVRLRVIACGSRSSTYEDFRAGMRANPNAINLLLVDSERPVSGPPRTHLSVAQHDNWSLDAVEDKQCHLMAQMMESWLVVDGKALAGFYGDGFRANALPKSKDIEKVAKGEIEKALKAATRDTQKREYHKMRHGPPLLERVDANLVRGRAPHCERLFKTIEDAIG